MIAALPNHSNPSLRTSQAILLAMAHLLNPFIKMQIPEKPEWFKL